ncbi:MAG: hypothetical protein KF797_13730 [Flavobacteriales bacterium]|nr:hypothetical protein [Flavobacteriales bacterium]
MGHSITAIVAPAPINEAAATKHGLPVIFEGAYAIVPLPIEYIWELAPDEDHGDEPTGLFNSQAPHQLARELGMAVYALIETDYFGGVGDQRASYHGADGKDLRDVSINVALHKLGVERTMAYAEPTPKAAPHGWLARLRSRWAKAEPIAHRELSELDEFDSLNLSDYRSMEDSRFWKEGMQGQRVGNILVGDRRVLG